MITAFASIETAIARSSSAPTIYIAKPFEIEERSSRPRRSASARCATGRPVQREVEERFGPPPDQHHRQEQRMRDVVASSSASLLHRVGLVTGESGTGKEADRARHHYNSPRASGPSRRHLARVPRRPIEASCSATSAAPSRRARRQARRVVEA